MPARTRRKPTYGAATRLARIVVGLFDRPLGWSVEEIRRELSIGSRTLQRYLRVCAEELVDRRGAPLLEVVQSGPRRVVRLRDSAAYPDARAMSAVSLFFTLSMIRFLEGTVLKEGADALWEKIRAALPAAGRTRLRNLERKFYAIAFVAKDYRRKSDDLDTIIQALVREYRLTVDYAGLMGEGRVHDVEPYSLVAYRGGLYLVGHSRTAGRITWLAVERIRSTVPTPGDGPRGTLPFHYPASFRPDHYTDGLFGVVEGEETEVELLLLNRETEAYLQQRTIHPSQRFTRRRDGRLAMTMRVRGTVELANWVMSTTPWVEVLRPQALRDEIEGRLEQALARYRRAAERGGGKRPARRQRRRGAGAAADRSR